MSFASWMLDPRSSVAAGPYQPWDDFWYGDPSYVGLPHAGVQVSDPEQAMRQSAVLRSVTLIGGLLAMMPEKVYESLDEERKREAREHRLWTILHDQPNEEQTSFDYRFVKFADVLLRGDHVAEIVRGRTGAFVGELRRIAPAHFRMDRTRNTRRRVYDVSSEHDGKARVLTFPEVHHVQELSLNGLTGLGRIAQAREGISLAFATEIHAARFFGAGARPGGFLRTDKKLDKEARKRNIDSWNQAHRGVGRSHEIAVMEGGLSFEQMQVSNNDSQFLETRRFQVADIARLFGVPLHLLMETEKSTSWGTGIEQMTLGFVTYTLAPLAAMDERATRRDLFEAGEPFFPEYNFDGLLRGDYKSRMDGHRIAITHGMLSPDEARAVENRNPRRDGKGGKFWRPGNMQTEDAGAPPPQKNTRQTAPPAR